MTVAGCSAVLTAAAGWSWVATVAAAVVPAVVVIPLPPATTVSR